MLTFDVETEAFSLEQIAHLMPDFDPASVKGIVDGDFDPSTVKLGNVKDQAKINEKIEQARASHEAAKANSQAILNDASERHVRKFLRDAALSATTARVLVIGYYSPPHNKMAIDDGKGDEATILVNFWKRYRDCREQNRPLVGVNCHDFDLPFITRRSWMLDVHVPPSALVDHRYWDKVFVDLRRLWLLGQHYSNCQSSFDHIGQAMGTGGKNGNGADFARLWREDRSAAIAYLESDLKQPAAWAARMGLV